MFFALRRPDVCLPLVAKITVFTMLCGPRLAKTLVFTQFSTCCKKMQEELFHAKGTKALQCFGSWQAPKKSKNPPKSDKHEPPKSVL